MPRGGKRRGAGRPVGSKNMHSLAEIREISTAAQSFATVALEALADVAQNSKSDAARVSASIALLDRGYGKPCAVEDPDTRFRALMQDMYERIESRAETINDVIEKRQREEMSATSQ